MKLDENAAAFGLFQLSFANLVQRFAVAVFFIQRINQPNLKFEDVFRRKFSRLREELKKELKQFDGRLHDMELQELRRVCAKAGDLAAWRNQRAHARVQIDENASRSTTGGRSND